MDRKSSQLISKKQQREIAQLKRANRKRLLKIGIILIAFLSIVSLFQPPARNDRAGVGTSQIRELDESAIGYLEWLKRRGTSTEIILFNAVSQSLHDAALEVETSANRNKIVQVYLSFLQGVQRIAFLAIAGIRLWIVLIVVGVLYGLRTLKPYRGRDMLGATGNGRLFYSGILADLSAVTEHGTPSKLVPGLACPQMKSAQEVIASPLGALLQKHNSLNKTTTALCGIILAYKDLPAYVGQSDDTKVQATFAGASLSDGALMMLSRAFEAYDALGSEVADGVNEIEPPRKEEKISLAEHGQHIALGFRRVVPLRLASALRSINKELIAACVLALEAGKVLSTGREGNRWVKKSQYPFLAARAVLHSVADFSEEYSFESRTVVRQALIYGSRFSVFGPVRLPTDLALATRALRQWVELLLSAPHELKAAIHEVELYGYACELHDTWRKAFFDGIISLNPQVVEGAVSTDTGLIFLPVTKVVSLFRTLVSASVMKRLDELVKTVSQLQRIQTMSQDLSPDATDTHRGPLPQYQRIFSPLSTQEVSEISVLNGIDPEMLKEWLVIRNIFNMYGWLARQVGSSSIPDHSCVSVVFKGIDVSIGGNEHNRIGRRALIPMRGSLIEMKLGKFWKTRFLQSSAAVIAEDVDSFEKLLQGIDLGDHDDAQLGTAT